MEGITSSVKTGLTTSIRITVNKMNVDDVENVAKLAGHLGVDRIELKGVLPIGRGKTAMMIENRILEETFSKALKATGKKTIVLCNYLPKCKGFNVEQNIACVCARKAIYIACNGTIIPCSYFPHKSDYNIHNNTLLEAWKSPLFEKVRNSKP